MKFVSDIRGIDDMADGETVGPELDMGYELRSIDGRIEPGTVKLLVRRGNRILARTTAGKEFDVTGANAHVLVPLGF